MRASQSYANAQSRRQKEREVRPFISPKINEDFAFEEIDIAGTVLEKIFGRRRDTAALRRQRRLVK